MEVQRASRVWVSNYEVISDTDTVRALCNICSSCNKSLAGREVVSIAEKRETHYELRLV